jgi:hypothetical protein
MQLGKKYILGGILGTMLAFWGVAPDVQAQTATATLASTGTNAYSITLHNTGTTTIGTFWYSWIPGEDFMGVAPTNVTSPAGWSDSITHAGTTDGYAIEWTAPSSSAYLAAGNSLTGFSFDSTLSATQLTTGFSPFYSTKQVGTSVVYTQGAFSSVGDTFVVQPVPEPATITMAMIAAAAWLALRGRHRFRRS